MKFKCNKCGNTELLIKIFKSIPDKNNIELVSHMEFYCNKCKDKVIK